ncbi:hypothetical protein [Micavibrio aeruginosavorus]|uniref:Uncharacterized protein n=1 Tax=Micavibrio aeruginosavorus EPB TaxID=349215 RepID=M4VJE8_9BACT|nr:hypothetical protein [Micavibrio aeruginosavorus]AGH98181.1 hypothetical protein A11S_1372 [Micavibrio aeruginosavorus EPB]
MKPLIRRVLLQVFPNAVQKNIRLLLASGDLNEGAFLHMGVQNLLAVVLIFFVAMFISSEFLGFVIGFPLSLGLSLFVVRRDFLSGFGSRFAIYLYGEKLSGTILERSIYWPSSVGYICAVDGVDDTIAVHHSRAYSKALYRVGDKIHLYVDRVSGAGVINSSSVKKKYCLKNSEAGA